VSFTKGDSGFTGCIGAAGGFAAALLLAGCGLFSSPSPSSFPTDSSAKAEVTSETKLRVGDQIQIRLDTGGLTPQSQPLPQEMVIDENGEISLPLIDRVKAAGLTSSELAERIQANYVPRYYVRCNVSVLVLMRFFYVGGEVRSPGRYNWTEDITLLKAINTSGGFTDYANRNRVEVVRGKQKIVVDCEELRSKPAKDVPILPGDSIWVARSIF
jgi:polysaccharide export outer membrane protein